MIHHFDIADFIKSKITNIYQPKSNRLQLGL